MRLLNRLNQYQRLWQPSAGKPQTVTVSELAERCFCSERHVRTSVTDAGAGIRRGWLEWQAQSGRGKRGQLRFLGHARIATQCDDGTGAGNRKRSKMCWSRRMLAPGGAAHSVTAVYGRTMAKPYAHVAYSRRNHRPARTVTTTGLFARPCRAASRRTDIFRPDPLR